jgi:Tol biopolymer transport system component
VARDGSLFIVDVDRRSVRRLTRCGRASCGDYDPSWAPRGAAIVFVRQGAIYSVRTNGSNLTRLTNLPGYPAHPVWSPDGSRIAFETSGVGEDDKVYAMRADGSELTLLRSGPSGTGPSFPLWSPDGTEIVVLTTPGTPGDFFADVWVIKADGSEARRPYQGNCRISSWAAPIWSPDGRYIAFGVGCSDPDQLPRGIFIMRADGTELVNLTTYPEALAWQRKP